MSKGSSVLFRQYMLFHVRQKTNCFRIPYTKPSWHRYLTHLYMTNDIVSGTYYSHRSGSKASPQALCSISVKFIHHIKKLSPMTYMRYKRFSFTARGRHPIPLTPVSKLDARLLPKLGGSVQIQHSSVKRIPS